MNIQVDIDQTFLNKAEEELFEILLQQRLSFNQRWHSNPLAVNSIKVLRVIALIASSLGVILCLLALIFQPAWQMRTYEIFFYLILFLVAGVLFFYLSADMKILQKWTSRISKNNCKKLALRCVKKARKQAPYQAEYEIKGNLIAYYRKKGGNYKLAWSRTMQGIAIQGSSVTVFFKKWTSIQPRIVVLHKNADQFNSVLTNLEIESRFI